MFAHKLNVSPRFRVDYQNVKAVTMQVVFSISPIDECIHSLGKATVFQTLDTNSKYWKLDTDNEDRDKTAFTSHRKQYRSVGMPFDLRMFQVSSIKWRMLPL